MPGFKYSAPTHFGNSVYSCQIPADNFRLKSLLILLGGGSVCKISSGKKIKLSTTFLQIPHKSSKKVLIQDIHHLFSSYSRRELDNFFKNNISKNIKIHKNIYHELLNAVAYFEKSNSIPCFLSIYRIIEQIALCLPIVSIIEKAAFQSVFTEYQKLIDSKAKSDLSVLRKYSEDFLDSSVGDSNITFNFRHTTNPTQNVGVMKRLLPQKQLANIVVSENADSIVIKNKYLHYPIVGFRNQYFHYLFHESNISHDDLEYPEEFLSVCNPHFINYYSFLFFDFIKAELSLWG